jgi:hypothetical protein
MKTRNKIVTLPLFGLLLAVLSPSSTVAETADAFGTRPVAENAMAQSDPGSVVKSYEDGSSKMHEAIARRHEDMAKGLQAKIQEQKQLLEQYESKSYIYGRWAQDLQAHADALIRKYEAAALTNLKQAALHRQLALKLKEGSGKSS